MTHFRGQIRGPHWGPTMDNMLIDFWRKHDCLFNSSSDSYYDKDLKARLWSEFASAVGKSEDVGRSGVLLLQGAPGQEGELETEGSVEQEVGSPSSSPMNPHVDLEDEPRFLDPPPRVSGVMSLSWPHPHDGAGDVPRLDVLRHFAEVMLADMRDIKDPLVLMGLRRDITDLVFRAAQEDEQRRCVPALSPPSETGERSLSCAGPRPTCYALRFLKRRSKRTEMVGRRRWEEMKRVRRTSRNHTGQQGAMEERSDGSSQVAAQAPDMKRQMHVMNIEEETLVTV
ncbi:uncharacterized protein [Antennarius striatus]|uniref:uncharacterized protein n=1 Tax=Antennarius striatus TaxID=241820 RepID=UPI0035AF0402